MDESNMSEALDAIHEEAVKLLQLRLPEEAQRIVDRIIALARYKFDARTEDERQG